MSGDMNGIKILRDVGLKPEAFCMTTPQINTIASYAILLKLKEKDLNIASLRSIAAMISDDDFKSILDQLSPKEAKSLAKLDEKHPDYKVANEHWHRAHINKLARAEIDPTPGPVRRARSASKAPKEETTAKTPKIGKIMASEAQATAGVKRKAQAKGKA